jgi:hypothetical protein
MNPPTPNSRQLFQLIETWATRGMKYHHIIAALGRRFGWDATEAENRIYDAEGYVSRRKGKSG